MSDPFILGPGEGNKFWLVGDNLRFALTAGQTGGEYSAAITWVGPGGGPPPHIHHREDELFYVLDGEVTVVYGRQTFVGGPGTAVFLKRGIPHTFANKTDRPALFIVIAVPSGFEDFVAECGTPIERIPSDLQMSHAAVEKLMAVASKYGLELRPEHRADTAVAAPEDRIFDVLGQGVRLKLDSAQTDGHFCVCEITSPAGSVLPMHRHLAMDELFYVVEGDLVFTLNGTEHAVTPGTFVFVPRGTPHRFANVGKRPSRLANFHTPGGFEKFFEECGGAFSRADLPCMLAGHGMELLD